MAGELYVVATPIGNLEDWTGRAQRVLASIDLLLAEDTRHTRRLLDRYDIHLPVRSYHDFNESGRAAEVLSELVAGAKIALVSDQGTPAISDPGYRLVRLCREQSIPVIPIPGPNAAIAALSVSGLPTDQFYYVGFLPSRKGARRHRFEQLREIEATLVLYEAPHRVLDCLRDLTDILGNRTIFVAREMTKLHEEYLFGPASDVAEKMNPKGEIVIVVGGAAARSENRSESLDLDSIPRPELLKLIARSMRVEKRKLYEALYRK